MWLLLTFCVFNVILIVTVDGNQGLDPSSHNDAFDLTLYNDVLDPEECARQLAYIGRNDTMLIMQFLDAGARFPRGFLTGNRRDMGNYYQCLSINKEIENMFIEGKYCVMHLPLQQNSLLYPTVPRIDPVSETDFAPKVLDEEAVNGLTLFNDFRSSMEVFLRQNEKESYSREAKASSFDRLSRLELALCIPKVCSVGNVVDSITPNFLGTLEFEEVFCRLPNDKPWVAADTLALGLFLFIGLVTFLSTSYDIMHTIVLKRDPKQANRLFTTFSVFTNSRTVFTFNTNPNAINCLDGIRSIAMMWIIVTYTFSSTAFFVTANPLEMLSSITEFSSLWITGAPITVDTFFMISGLLLVYTTASKLSRMDLLKNLHLFYLHRFLRIFPVLATAVLMQASILNRVTDGPYWYKNARNTNNCREYWWSTLLFVQNFVNPDFMCLNHSWYLTIDMQLYIISPIVLYWVLGGSRKTAWIALAGALTTVLAASTIYNYLMKFPVSLITLAEEEVRERYMKYYYIHTLPRAAPFFVGMLIGYALYLCKEKKVRIPRNYLTLLWFFAIMTSTLVFMLPYFTMQPYWNIQFNDIVNSLKRPVWAASIAWLVFACAKGYGGPINWFLSLHIFKILGRLSFAMYILQYSLIFVINGTTLSPIFFSVENYLQRFLIHFTVTTIAAYIITVAIELPFFRLIERAMRGWNRLRQKEDDPFADMKKYYIRNGPDKKI